jgi:hypothetical protein
MDSRQREQLESNIAGDEEGQGKSIHSFHQNKADGVMFLHMFIANCQQRLLEPAADGNWTKKLLTDAPQLLKLYHDDLSQNFEFPRYFYQTYQQEYTRLVGSNASSWETP